MDASKYDIKISRKDLFEKWLENPEERVEKLVDYVWTLSESSGPPSSENYQAMKSKIKTFSDEFRKRWERSYRSKPKFMTKFSAWLNKDDFSISLVLEESYQDPSQKVTGRPTKSFNTTSEKSKRRKVAHLLDTGAEELIFAARAALHDSGQRIAASVLKEATASPDAALVMRKRMSLDKKCNGEQFSPEEALDILVDCGLSKDTYTYLRQRAIDKGHELFPPYHKIQQAKNNCYVPDDMKVDDTRADVSLQALVDHTAQRLATIQQPVLEQVVGNDNLDFELLFKWGCDGSGGHSVYKQKFAGDDVSMTDEYMFMYSLVPLQLRVKTNSESYSVVWHNNTPGSPRFCRPIKYMFEKESVCLIKRETNQVFEQISNLKPTLLTVNSQEIKITHKLFLTMADGKVCNALTGTKSAQKCYICGATPKIMNNSEQHFPEDIIDNYSFGLSPLHALIRSFECLIHISYRLDIQKWRVKKDCKNNEDVVIADDDQDGEGEGEHISDQQKMKKRKIFIQDQFKIQLGLNVDKPKQGFGSSNDGNTARSFFRNADISALITGINEDLIKRFAIILQTIASGFGINLEKFEKYVLETRQLYLNLYQWYPMPVTVHKLLYHSTEIIKYHLVPIGMLTEESQEARNKHLRNLRLHHTQKKITRLN